MNEPKTIRELLLDVLDATIKELSEDTEEEQRLLAEARENYKALNE